MKKSFLSRSGRLRLLLFLSSGLVLLFVPRAGAQSPSQDPQTAPSTTAPAPQTDAEKKAAERKKRFEEQKRLLDGGGSGSAAAGPSAAKHTPRTDSVFWMDLIGLNMVPNQSQEIHVWDMYNNDVSARVSWGLSDTGVVDLAVKHHAIITAKMPGTVSVIGTIDGHIVEAIVTVYRGEKLPPGIAPSVYGQLPRRTGGRRNVMTVTVEP